VPDFSDEPSQSHGTRISSPGSASFVGPTTLTTENIVSAKTLWIAPRALFLTTLLVSVLGEAGSVTAQAVDIPLQGAKNADGIPPPWELRVKKGTADFTFQESGGPAREPALCLRANDASFSLNRKVSIDVADFNVLSWSWKADSFPQRNNNDQVLQILLYFHGGRVLSYVWDIVRPKESTWSESIRLALSVKVIAVQANTEKGRWTTVVRRVDEDYSRVYGDAVRDLEGIRIQSNSQYSHSVGSGCISKLSFRRDPG
jgi:Protein of unknown function (DUF3047)